MNAVTPAQAQPKTGAGPAPTGGGAQRAPVSPGAFSFMPVKSVKKSKYLNILMYSAAGGGKTTLAGSAADVPESTYSKGFQDMDSESSDVLLVSAEGGDIVFDDNPRIKHPGRIDMMKADRIEQVQKVYEWLKYHIHARDLNNGQGDEAQLRKLQNTAFFGNGAITLEEADEIAPDFDNARLRRYRTVIIDSLTDIEAQNMNHIMGISDKGFDIGDDIQVAGFGEFRKNNNTIQQLVRAFRDLRIHVIIICGQKYQQDELKRFHYGPWMTGQLATQIQSFVDIVGYMVPSATAEGKEIRKLYVQPVPQVKFDAKCRIASYKKPSFDDPFFIDILRECKYV
ncbi:hypothetical protein STASHLEY_00020 [Brevundimonas phage vB_BpoS-StAshley]|nr:hypothetical protein STASHLEY_00020 [Brevundimonas phage vB_BpoS-StAshley]UTC30131.1 hypothetical protein MAINES_00920 [Brevundimonas phage vB_BpoS-MaInes]